MVHVMVLVPAAPAARVHVAVALDRSVPWDVAIQMAPARSTATPARDVDLEGHAMAHRVRRALSCCPTCATPLRSKATAMSLTACGSY